MTVPVFPTGIVRDADRTLAVAAAAVTSPFTGSQDIQDWDGEWWEYNIEVALRLGQKDGRSLSSFFAKLRGPVTPFLFADPSVLQTGSYGSPLVNGAAQTGNTLVTDGWSATGLKDGDFFSLGSGSATEFYQLTADVLPNSGAATLEFVPALRSSPADNVPLEVVNPQVLLRLTSPVPTRIRPYDKYQFSFTAREAI